MTRLRYVSTYIILASWCGGVLAAPPDPSQVAVSAGVNQLSISWSASAGAAGYKVYREIAGAYVLLDTVPGTTFSDSWKTADTWGQAFGNGYGRLGLPRGIAQNYRVTAYDDVGESIGVAASGTTVAAGRYTTDKVRGIVNLIVSSTDHMVKYNPTVEQIKTVHDWVRDNFTTNITLWVSMQWLQNPNSPVTVYLQSLVHDYGYDIVTLPHVAWFPTVSGWWGNYAGIETEIANMQTAHERCFSVFGKYPVAAAAWHYNKDLVSKAVSLGYKLAPSGICEQTGIDGFSCLGNPWGWYKPSKNNNMMPGDGNASHTQDIIVGLSPLKTGSYRTNFEVMHGKTLSGVDFCGDIFTNLLSQQRAFTKVIEDSDNDINSHIVAPFYLDPYWLFTDSKYTCYVPDGSRDTNQWHVDKELMLWFADRYGADKILGVEALATWLQTKINNAHPCPPLFLWDYNEVEGHEFERGWRYDSQYYSVMCRWQAGTQGYIRFIQELPYDVNNVEPRAPASNWSNTGGALRQCDTYPNNPPAQDPVRSRKRCLRPS